VRCAIYTRKSADERLDSQLGSTTRQRELCEAYVTSQSGQGWHTIPTAYEDIGFSGGTLKRPALARLLADAALGKIDVILVYKIDRLSRSLRDFLDMIETFERHDVVFVAITQSFDTGSSTGRLMLNVLLSFAQFERELTSERLRDWLEGARQRGLWTGRAPFGYDCTDKRLTINDEQARAVRLAFRHYPRVKSSRAIAEMLNARGYLNRDGRPWMMQAVNDMLHNRLYRGDLVHDGKVVKHQAFDPIVSETEFRRAQATIAESPRRKAGIRGSWIGTLAERIYGSRGQKLIHLAQPRRGKVYRYYVPSTIRYRVYEPPLDRYRAEALETAVVDKIEEITGATLATDRHVAAGQIRRLLRRIDVEPEQVQLEFNAGGVFRAPHDAEIKVRSG